MKNKREIDDVLRVMEGLPEFERKSVCWFMQNIRLAQQLCNADEPISEEELKTEIQWARDTQDYAYFALLLYQSIVQKK